MKIAVASEKEMVTGHFGHCENFNIYNVVAGKIEKSESVPTQVINQDFYRIFCMI